VSEWSASRKYTGDKFNFQAANVAMLLMWNMLRGGISAAAYWPPAAAAPGVNLIDWEHDNATPILEAFRWMARGLVGNALGTSYDYIPLIAARKDNQIIVFLLGHDRGPFDVTVRFVGYTISSVVAHVMYSPNPRSAELPKTAVITDATVTDNTVKVTINAGGEGRSCVYEIIRLILQGVAEP
jgi:hypothetical protein